MLIVENHLAKGEAPRSHHEVALVRQKTLKSAINCTGIALHSGRKVRMALSPAKPDSGITFIRTDVQGDQVIPARWDRVVDTRLCTMIGNEAGVTVGTIEHLMAAFAGLGVDNVTVKLDGPEVPVMDGSSEPFVFLIECAGIAEQEAPRRAIRILKAVTFEDDHCAATLTPGDGFSVSFDMDYEARGIRRQAIRVGLVNGTFKKELARARTFGFLQDVERMRTMGLGRGGSLENAIVVDGGRVLNPEGLRYENEFVRHKSLDAVGDLYLAGATIVGHFHGTCSGHTANNRLLRALFADESAWCAEVLGESEASVREWDEPVRLVANA